MKNKEKKKKKKLKSKPQRKRKCSLKRSSRWNNLKSKKIFLARTLMHFKWSTIPLSSKTLSKKNTKTLSML